MLDKIPLLHILKTCGQHLFGYIDDLQKLDSQDRERANNLFHKIKLNLFEIKLTRQDLLEIGLKIDEKNDIPWFEKINEEINLLKKKFGIET
jgi:hypothetical protein